MNVQSVSRTLSTFLLLLLVLGSAAAWTPPRKGGITVEDYCRLTQSLMELSVKEWEQRADLAATSKGDRKKLTAKLEAVTKEYRPLREEVYSQYGMTSAEDLRYASEHQSEIADYLDEHPDIRDSIDSLKARINALIEQVESATTAPPEGAHR